MNTNQSAGILAIVIGLIFIIFPMFSSELISIIIGLSLLFFGITSLFMGINTRNSIQNTSMLNMIIGIVAIIFGFLFIFYIDALSFLVGVQFYIIGFIMILFGLTGIFSDIPIPSTTTSVIILVIGIIAVLLAVFALAEPIYITILIGVCLVIQGVALLIN